MGRYSDIIARLESASGPDRELSIAVGAALGAVEKHFDVGDGDAETWWEFPDGERLGHFTASLDAAIGLVERVLPVDRHFAEGSPASSGWRFGVQRVPDPKREWYAWIRAHARYPVWDFSRTPAIALLLVLFRALEAQEAGE